MNGRIAKRGFFVCVTGVLILTVIGLVFGGDDDDDGYWDALHDPIDVTWERIDGINDSRDVAVDRDGRIWLIRLRGSDDYKVVRLDNVDADPIEVGRWNDGRQIRAIDIADDGTAYVAVSYHRMSEGDRPGGRAGDVLELSGGDWRSAVGGMDGSVIDVVAGDNNFLDFAGTDSFHLMSTPRSDPRRLLDTRVGPGSSEANEENETRIFGFGIRNRLIVWSSCAYNDTPRDAQVHGLYASRPVPPDSTTRLRWTLLEDTPVDGDDDGLGCLGKPFVGGRVVLVPGKDRIVRYTPELRRGVDLAFDGGWGRAVAVMPGGGPLVAVGSDGRVWVGDVDAAEGLVD